MAATTENEDESASYVIAQSSPFPPGRFSIILDTSYDAFARRHGVGACRVRISLPDETSFETPASIAIIDSRDPVAARPVIMLYQSEQLTPLPAGSHCRVLPNEPNVA